MNTEQQTIRLRAIEPEDLDLLYKIENDTMLWDVGNTNVPYSRYVLHDYIANANHDIYADKQVRMMVETGNGEVVGIADIVDFDPRHRRAEIGLVIMARHRRKGYAAATIRQMVDYADRVLHLHQLYAYIDCANTSSLELFLKTGFSQNEKLKDWLYDGHEYHDAWFMQLFIKKAM